MPAEQHHTRVRNAHTQLNWAIWLTDQLWPSGYLTLLVFDLFKRWVPNERRINQMELKMSPHASAYSRHNKLYV